MTQPDRYRRIVAWADGSDQAARAGDWAARHAAARALPLHVLYLPRLPALAVAGRGRDAGPGFAVRDESASDMERVAGDVQRLRTRYQGLRVTEQIVWRGCHRPEPGMLEPGDILVTWPGGYLELVEPPELEESTAARVPAPTVFVPDGATRAAPAANAARVLLLTGRRFFPAAAWFAFAAAADLGAGLEAVRLPGAYDDEYAAAPGRGPDAVGRHMRAELAKLRGRFLAVPGESRTLGPRPWPALRALTGDAQLAVLGAGAGCGVDVRAVYDVAACPVAVVPEPAPYPDEPVEDRTAGAARSRSAPAHVLGKGVSRDQGPWRGPPHRDPIESGASRN